MCDADGTRRHVKISFENGHSTHRAHSRGERAAARQVTAAREAHAISPRVCGVASRRGRRVDDAFDAAAEAEADELVARGAARRVRHVRRRRATTCPVARVEAGQRRNPIRRAQPAAVHSGWARGECDCVAAQAPRRAGGQPLARRWPSTRTLQLPCTRGRLAFRSARARAARASAAEGRLRPAGTGTRQSAWSSSQRRGPRARSGQ